MTYDFTGKRVCVTGGAGMIGSQLVEQLLRFGADVLVLDDFSRGNNLIEGAEYMRLDASRSEDCSFAFRGMGGKQVDIVFNLAATVAGVLHNQQHNVNMFNRNILLQTVPVEVADWLGIETFVQVSSVCIYAPDQNHPCLELNGHVGEPQYANGGYAWAKRMGEKVALLSGIEHMVIVRPSNVFGPRDYFDDKAHVIPNLIKKCISDDAEIEMVSPPDIKREFIFTRDVAAGMIAAAVHGKPDNAYNLGTHGKTCVTLRELLHAVQEACGTNKPVRWLNNRADPGDPARWSDSSKAHTELHWESSTSLEDGLRETMEWMLKK